MFYAILLWYSIFFYYLCIVEGQISNFIPFDISPYLLSSNGISAVL